METISVENIQLTEEEIKKLNEAKSNYSSPIGAMPEDIKTQYVPVKPYLKS